MKHYIQKIIIFLLFFLCSFSRVDALETTKINSLVFDSADGLIYLQTNKVDENTTITKGYLKEPDRIYVDINNAVLTTPKKSYETKYSVFNNIKISQFTTEPMTVRLVFEYDKKFDLSSFKIYKSNGGIFIKTAKTLVDNQKHKTIYSNSKTSERTVFYKGAQFIDSSPLSAADIITVQGAPKNEITEALTAKKTTQGKIGSKYYIDSVLKTNDGVLIAGIGKVSLVPTFVLAEPDRLIMDLDDTVVNPDIRNKTYAIGELQTAMAPQGAVSVDTRDTIKIGQNSQSLARLVIQGKNAKDYRAIISPDSRNLYITRRSNIITTKMADINVNLTAASKTESQGYEIITLTFDDSAALSMFEENSKLYLDIANINAFNDSMVQNLIKARPDIQTTRLATDKLRFVIPEKGGYVGVKTTPDNDEIKIYSKIVAAKKTENKSDISLTPVIKVEVDKQPAISNLFTVVIDAGHGGDDVGATRFGIYEKDINLKVAKLVEKNLNKKKVKTYMVRDKDKTVSLQERSDFSNAKKPNVFVSIHVNSSTNDTSYGVETHYWKDDSVKYGSYVHNEMQKNVKKWDTTDRGLLKSQFYVINHTEAPAILCEIGFISNAKERGELLKSKRQEEIAEAISEGIYKYLKAAK